MDSQLSPPVPGGNLALQLEEVDRRERNPKSRAASILVSHSSAKNEEEWATSS